MAAAFSCPAVWLLIGRDMRVPKARSSVERGSGRSPGPVGGATPAPPKPLVLHSDWTAFPYWHRPQVAARKSGLPLPARVPLVQLLHGSWVTDPEVHGTVQFLAAAAGAREWPHGCSLASPPAAGAVLGRPLVVRGSCPPECGARDLQDPKPAGEVEKAVKVVVHFILTTC